MLNKIKKIQKKSPKQKSNEELNPNLESDNGSSNQEDGVSNSTEAENEELRLKVKELEKIIYNKDRTYKFLKNQADNLQTINDKLQGERDVNKVNNRHSMYVNKPNNFLLKQNHDAKRSQNNHDSNLNTLLSTNPKENPWLTEN